MVRPEVVREFQQECEYYRTERRFSWSFGRQRHEVLSLLGPGSGAVLDLGAGPALLCPDIVSLGYTYVATDIVFEMLQEATSTMSAFGAELVIGDAGTLPFRDQSFVAVVGMGVLEYAADLGKALSEIRRVLATTGAAILTVPHRSSPYRLSFRAWLRSKDLGKRLVRPRRNRASAPTSSIMSNVLTPRQWRDAVRKAEFRVIADGFCNCRVVPAPLDQWIPRFADRLGAAMEPLCTKPFVRAVGTQYIMKLVSAGSVGH